MKKMIIMLLLAVISFACSSTPAEMSKVTPVVKSCAVVSFSINNYGSGLRTGLGGRRDDLVMGKTNEALEIFEKKLARKFKVKKAESFVGSDVYRAESIDDVKEGLYNPYLNGKSMLNFSNDKNVVIQGYLPEGAAQSLCKVLGVDALVLVYTEWTVGEVGYVVTFSKALAKTCVAMWDKNGEKYFLTAKMRLGIKLLDLEVLLKLMKRLLASGCLLLKKELMNYSIPDIYGAGLFWSAFFILKIIWFSLAKV